MNYRSPDSFMLQLDSMDAPVFFCKPNATWTVTGTTYSTSAEACRTLIGIFLAAKAQDKTFTGIYFDGDEVSGGVQCMGLVEIRERALFPLGRLIPRVGNQCRLASRRQAAKITDIRVTN